MRPCNVCVPAMREPADPPRKLMNGRSKLPKPGSALLEICHAMNPAPDFSFPPFPHHLDPANALLAPKTGGEVGRAGGKDKQIGRGAAPPPKLVACRLSLASVG